MPFRRVPRENAGAQTPWPRGGRRIEACIPTNGQTGLQVAGLAINDDTALAITTVYTAVGILADSIATLPLVAYRRGDEQRGTVPNPPKVLTNPMGEGTLVDFLSQVVVSMCLRGNFYAIKSAFGADGFPTVLTPVHPDQVTARRLDNGQREYKIRGRYYDPALVLHIPNLLQPGSFIGMNPIEYARQSFGVAAAAARYGGQFFANSANPSGVLEVPGDLSPEETLELSRAWRQAHQGLGYAGMPAVLTGGVTWKTTSISPDDAQFLATRTFEREEIAAFFRVPMHKLGVQDRTPTDTGVESMEIAFVTDTLQPYLTKIESYLASCVPGMVEPKFDTSDRLRGNTLQRWQAYNMAINSGGMSIDEARRKENLPPLPDGSGKVYYRPLNFAPTTAFMNGNVPSASSSGGVGGGSDNSPDAPAPGAPVKPPNPSGVKQPQS